MKKALLPCLLFGFVSCLSPHGPPGSHFLKLDEAARQLFFERVVSGAATLRENPGQPRPLFYKALQHFLYNEDEAGMQYFFLSWEVSSLAERAFMRREIEEGWFSVTPGMATAYWFLLQPTGAADDEEVFLPLTSAGLAAQAMRALGLNVSTPLCKQLLRFYAAHGEHEGFRQAAGLLLTNLVLDPGIFEVLQDLTGDAYIRGLDDGACLQEILQRRDAWQKLQRLAELEWESLGQPGVRQPETLAASLKLAKTMGTGSRLWELLLCDTFSRLYQQLGDWEQVEKYNKEMLKLAGSLIPPGAHPLLSTALTNLAAAEELKGNSAGAIEFYRQALESSYARQPAGRHPETVLILRNLALLYYTEQRFREALPLQEQIVAATRTFPPWGQHWEYYTALLQQARLYLHLERHADAWPLMQQLEAVVRFGLSGEVNYGQITFINNLALMYYSLGQDEQTELLLLQVLQMLKTAAPDFSARYYRQALESMLIFYRTSGREDKIRPLLEDSLPTLARLPPAGGNQDYASTLANLAFLFRKQGDFSRADMFYRDALKILATLEPVGRHPDYAVILDSLADLYAFMENYGEAEKFYRKALAIRVELEPAGSHPDYARSLNNLGAGCLALDKFEEAQEHFDKAIRILENQEPRGQHPMLASVLDNLGQLYKETGQYSQAEDLHLRALDIFRTLSPPGRHFSYALCLNNLGQVYQMMGQYDTALEKCTLSCNILQEIAPQRQHEDYLKVRNNLAAIYSELGNYREAERLYSLNLKVLRLKAPAGKHPMYATALNNLAYLYIQMGLYKKALESAGEAREIQAEFAPSGWHPAYALTLNNLAMAHYLMGDFRTALELNNEVLKIRESYSSRRLAPEYGQTLNNLARILTDTGMYSDAEKMFEKALKIAEGLSPAGQHPYYARILANLADLYQMTGRYLEVESTMEKALEITAGLAPLRESPQHAFIQHNLAKLYLEIGQYAKAEKYLTPALAIRKKLSPENKHPDYAASLELEATLSLLHGDKAGAERLQEQALDIMAGIHPAGQNLNYITALINLAGIYTVQADYAGAEQRYRRALSIIEEQLGRTGSSLRFDFILANLGHISFLRKNYREAKDYYQQALAAAEMSLPAGGVFIETGAYNLELAAICLETGDYPQAEIKLLMALNIFRDYIRAYFPALSEEEKLLFLQTLDNVFRIFYNLLEKNYQYSPVLAEIVCDLQLFCKAGILRSTRQMREEIRRSEDPGLLADYEHWVILKTKLSRALECRSNTAPARAADIQAWQEEANRLEKKLWERSHLFSQSCAEYNFTWQDVQRTLPPGAAALEMVRYEVHDAQRVSRVHYGVLLLKAGSMPPGFLVLGEGERIENELLTRYRNFIALTAASQVVREDQATYALLYRYLWQPLETSLNGIELLYYAPDGVYHFINPATLQNGKGRFLDSGLEIRRLTSLRDLVEPARQKIPGGPPLLVGSPAFELEAERRREVVMQRGQQPGSAGRLLSCHRGEFLQPLPATKEEVEAIDRLFAAGGEPARVLLEEEALEALVKQASNPRVLHLATHAFFQAGRQPPDDFLPVRLKKAPDENPLLQSGLFFSGAAAALRGEAVPEDLENGILTALEARELSLEGTELVVLSACETGLGEVMHGEGVYGLQRAFLQAGAGAVLMSLWKVADEVTSEFMQEFYRSWLSGLGKHEAYQAAVEALRLRYPAPAFWGAFVLVGK